MFVFALFTAAVSWIAGYGESTEPAQHFFNAAVGFSFGISFVKFFTLLGKVLEIAGRFAWFLLTSSVVLAVSGGLLLYRFNQIMG